jgi:putative membrane-bound dehydrogenase-like protein
MMNRIGNVIRNLSLMGALMVIVGFLVAVVDSFGADFIDPDSDRDAVPSVPPGFEVTMFAREPLVRQPCSMAFDTHGRLFVGMGPQYRSPKPDTPGDSVVIISDTDGDGRGDQTTVFATGFNAIQGLAWHGKDLWVANAPDLTVVRDLDGDDQADEYVLVYTDLGNLEHGLHGLTWAPDGKLYMSKGNSKGMNLSGRTAPKPFRDLWGVEGPPGAADFPQPITFRKGEYQKSYHDPDDDWGMDGGVLRCDDGGHNLEIVARGFRNPWDIAADAAFNWLGTDNDQTEGDRVFMPFYGAHFGWNHPWASHWSDVPHAPTAPVSGPLFEGSGTGIVFGDSPAFPPEFRGVFFINDWLNKTTFVFRPEWDGALLRPRGGTWEPFVIGGKALYRPTDLEVGPDGALWILGWSSGYGAEWKDGELSNEGRVFRVAPKDAGLKGADVLKVVGAEPKKPLSEMSVAELIDRLNGPLPVWRIDAQDELVARGRDVVQDLMDDLIGDRPSETQRTEMQETWIAWALGRMLPGDSAIDEYFAGVLSPDSAAGLNLRIQALRILAHRIGRESGDKQLPPSAVAMLGHAEPRIRFAAVQAIHQADQRAMVPRLLESLSVESDTATFYAGWQALRSLASTADLRLLLTDSRPAVRRAALLAILEGHGLKPFEVKRLADDPDEEMRQIARLWSEKAMAGGEAVVVRGRPLRSDPAGSEAADSFPREVVFVRGVQAVGQRDYQVVMGGTVVGGHVYTDRGYRLTEVAPELVGADMIRTANEDDGSSGEVWLSGELLLPSRVFVAIDSRQAEPPAWVRDRFARSDLKLATDDCSYDLYQRDYPAGPFALGGNTDDGRSGGKSHYLVVLEALTPKELGKPSAIDEVMELVEKGDAGRGEVLFKHRAGAGCVKCHVLDGPTNGFGPDLRAVGSRATPRHLVESILDPSVVITEGFNQVTVVTDDGTAYAGVLLEESGLSLSLGLSSGDRIDIPKSLIEDRQSSRVSAMPSAAPFLTPQQAADVVAFLLTLNETTVAAAGQPAATPSIPVPPLSKPPLSKPEGDQQRGLSVQETTDRLMISYAGKPLTEYVFHDTKVLRPHFADVRSRGGLRVTRNHPPVVGIDDTDHETMHPGIWLGFGDVNGVDFWRNEGHIRHVRFLRSTGFVGDHLVFATESQWVTPGGEVMGQLVSRFLIADRPEGWLLVWDATIGSETVDIVFGDQEEMGFGARVATPLTEKNGGLITSSTGQTTASATWGQAAAWCDYSGSIDGTQAGVMLMAAPENFRASWWHNRDYGVFIANPFGRQAMKQGDRSAVTVPKGETLRIRFAASIHDGTGGGDGDVVNRSERAMESFRSLGSLIDSEAFGGSE